MFEKLRQRLGGRPQPVPPKPSPQRWAAPLAVSVTDATFSELVERASLPAVVDFWAEWCQPCQIIASYIEFLARDYAGRLVVASVDVDENPQTPQRFQVMGLPTLLLLDQGREVGRIVGVASYAEIQEQVERLLRQPNC